MTTNPIDKFIGALDTYIEGTAELSARIEKDIEELTKKITLWKQSSTKSQVTC